MGKASFLVPLEFARAELNVLNSRFIASLDYVDSVEHARAFIERIRQEFPDASHNVPAFIVGGGKSSTEFCSDDGEPSGTSGRPLLTVLHGSGLGNIAVVVTRYFGGTLLGTGGLVKAYSEAGKIVVDRAQRGMLTALTNLHVDLPYSRFDVFKSSLSQFNAFIRDEKFAEIVSINVEVPSDEVERFNSKLADLSSGSVKPLFLGERIARFALSDNGVPSR